MRILRVHNHYQQFGGEDVVFQSEARLLEQHGHEVFRLEFTNQDILYHRSPLDALKLGFNTVWSHKARRRIGDAVDSIQPSIVHFDNTFPLVSPSAYGAVKARGIPVVQTLHNFRLLCPSGTLYHNSRIYEDNIGRLIPWRAVRDRAYRDSVLQTGVVAAMLTTHRLLRTYQNAVDCYIALSEFQREMFENAGFDPRTLVVKPNFTVGRGDLDESKKRSGFLYIGRLSPEKGIPSLLSAFSQIAQTLLIAGDGPLVQMVRDASDGAPAIQYLGHITGEDLRHRLSTSQALVFPSEWNETFGLSMIEAFATGTPVIASRIGSIAEIVEDGISGLLFEAGDAEDLAAKVTWSAEHPEEMQRMGRNARRVYEEKYTPEGNYEMLMEIYRLAIERRHQAK